MHQNTKHIQSTAGLISAMQAERTRAYNGEPTLFVNGDTAVARSLALRSFLHKRNISISVAMFQPDHDLTYWESVFNTPRALVKSKLKHNTVDTHQRKLAALHDAGLFNPATGELNGSLADIMRVTGGTPAAMPVEAPTEAVAPVPERNPPPIPEHAMWDTTISREEALEVLTAEDILGIIQGRLDEIPVLEEQVARLAQSASESEHWQSEASRLARRVAELERIEMDLRNKISGINMDLERAREDLAEAKRGNGLRLFGGSRKVG